MKNKNLNILLVEDEKYILDCIKEFLIKIGFKNITCCYDGKNALEKIKTKNMDVAIIDLLLPNGIHGEKVLEKIKEKNSKSVVVIITGQININLNHYISKGAIDVLQKPFSLTKIEALLNYVAKFKGNFNKIINELLNDCPCNKNELNCPLINIRNSDKKMKNNFMINLSEKEKEKIIYSHFRCKEK